jgi:hypothetical protein
MRSLGSRDFSTLPKVSSCLPGIESTIRRLAVGYHGILRASQAARTCTRIPEAILST